MSRQEILFRAALTRFVLGTAALVLLPVLYPAMREARWVFGAYLALAAIEQVLIRKEIGGTIRSLAAGIVDMAIISFLVHALGSATTIFASLYLFAGFLNAMVVGRRVGVALSILNACAFAAIVWAEHFGLLAFAPDAPEVALLGPPSFGLALAVSVLMTIFLVASTTIDGLLATQLHAREREREIERARRGHSLRALMIDLDGFERVNDLRRHARGDAMLPVTASVGIAAARPVDDVASLLHRADENAYRAKQGGGNRVAA